MKLRAIAGVIALLLVATAPATAASTAPSAQEADCTFPVERTDATGTTVTIEEEPDRIVTLNPSAAQTLWEMGARDKVVGVTKHAMNLDGAAEKTNVSGAGQTINNEKVVGLERDLVLVPNATQEGHVEQLREAGLTVFHFDEATSVDDIYGKTRLIGELTGECEAAEETVSWMQTELAIVDEAVADRERPGAIYTFFGYTVGEGAFIDNIIERAGADNVAAEAGIQGYKEMNEEVLVSRNPDWIVRNTDAPTVPRTDAYNSTTAVQQDQIVVLDTNHLNQPAPRVVYAIANLTEAMHPDAYAAAQASGTANGTDGTAATDAADATTTGDGGPGFTGVGALLAVACLGLLAGRRA